MKRFYGILLLLVMMISGIATDNAFSAQPVGKIKNVAITGFNMAEQGFDVAVTCNLTGVEGKQILCMVVGLDSQGKMITTENGGDLLLHGLFEGPTDDPSDIVFELLLPQKSLKGVDELNFISMLMDAETEEVIAESDVFAVDELALRETMMNQAESTAAGLLELFLGITGGGSGGKSKGGSILELGDDDKQCPSCYGDGRCYSCGGSGIDMYDDKCDRCYGSGKCQTCYGSGTVRD